MAQSVQLSQDLYDVVTRRANSQDTTTDALVAEWVLEKVNEAEWVEADEAIGQELLAFQTLKPELLKQFPGEYVATYQAQVVGHDANRLSLIKDVYNRFGEVPCLVKKVTAEKPKRVRIPSI